MSEQLVKKIKQVSFFKKFSEHETETLKKLLVETLDDLKPIQAEIKMLESNRESILNIANRYLNSGIVCPHRIKGIHKELEQNQSRNEVFSEQEKALLVECDSIRKKLLNSISQTNAMASKELLETQKLCFEKEKKSDQYMLDLFMSNRGHHGYK
ncbi:hypothetical protein [Flocculibacter collagenilyticus]|uniref:hypothetical protein n=1 Tax=Flocculibacter collagenilyticus TaxID=2744479 RepID=UPI0018F7917E|nr:hypothetical protein [Flocculibacter collagenilyticus]